MPNYTDTWLEVDYTNSEDMREGAFELWETQRQRQEEERQRWIDGQVYLFSQLLEFITADDFRDGEEGVLV